MVPLILGGLAVAIGAALMSDDNKSSTCTSSDQDDREREARKRAKKARNDAIHQEIREYKDAQIAHFQNKYNARVEADRTTQTKLFVTYKDTTRQDKINTLQNEINELQEALHELEAMRYATVQ